MTRVKICGIRSEEEARWAVAAGAWAVGLVFAPSPRQVTVEQAASFVRQLPPQVYKVGVFVDASRKEVSDVVKHTGINMLQFHGRETPEYCEGWHLPVIKSFRVKDADSLAGVEEYRVYAWHFDAYREGYWGGTGTTFDWHCLQALKPGARVILAGGLQPGNVAWAVHVVRPYAVDVSSGVERAGRKDRKLIEQFIANARRCNECHS
ncbi:MAG: phosphoribosylanthranilate isomerase [Syntrophomonadaceae bacterium]|nr:phosphoribosylanthranilate isomerase [Syntrophomonadaceae bacterium]